MRDQLNAEKRELATPLGLNLDLTYIFDYGVVHSRIDNASHPQDIPRVRRYTPPYRPQCRGSGKKIRVRGTTGVVSIHYPPIGRETRDRNPFNDCATAASRVPAHFNARKLL